ncbi:MAG TPA: uroporphyrinogen-III synthase [Candidatus Cybelea sp.]|nr:uroporphyrinogen-III synthase [Candidatus Cybelea sp.]
MLVTRPRDDAEEFAAALRTLGVEPVIEPMFAVRFLDAPLDLAGVQALLLTSRNGVRALTQASGERALPVFAVGDATASEARAAGFASVVSAEGDAAALAALAGRRLDPAKGVLVHVAGTEVAGDLAGALKASGFAVRRIVLYEARPVTELTPATYEDLVRGHIDSAAFFSPRTAATFVRLASAEAIESVARNMTAYCLSPAAAEAAGSLPWSRVIVAAKPNQPELLRLIETEVRPS